MEAVLNHLILYRYFYLLFIFVIILIVLLIATKPKKVKPLEITIDDIKEEKSEIEKVLESLEEGKNSRPMTTFEEEQEANAIISYQELVEAVRQKKGLTTTNAVVEAIEEVKPEITEITNIEISEPTLSEIEIDTNKVVELLEKVEPKEEPKKFKSSEFISPIFGKDSNRSNDDFLRELKDFRSNL